MKLFILALFSIGFTLFLPVVTKDYDNPPPTVIDISTVGRSDFVVIAEGGSTKVYHDQNISDVLKQLENQPYGRKYLVLVPIEVGVGQNNGP